MGRTISKTNEIIELLKTTELSYKDIGDKFGLSKQRIFQIAIKNDLGHTQKRKRIFWSKKCFEVHQSLQKTTDLKKIAEEHSVVLEDLIYYYKIHQGEPLRTTVRLIRDEEIMDRYLNGSSAKTIIESSDSKVVNPNRLETTDGVYGVNRRNGIKRFPKIGTRSKGGLFENSEIMKLIIKYKEKGMSCIKISEVLNSLGYLTITGVPFTGPNVWSKYNRRELLV